MADTKIGIGDRARAPEALEALEAGGGPPTPGETAPEIDGEATETGEETPDAGEEATETGAEATETGGEAPGEGKAGARTTGSEPVRRTAIALTVVASCCAAWSGWSWYAAAHDETLRYARTRDAVLRAGEQAVQNLNTLDYRTVDDGLKIWQDSSTSELYQQIVRGRPQFEDAVAKARTVTSARVLDAAVTELDEHAGQARVIVALQITVTPPEGDPVVKKTRLVGRLTRTAAGWRLSGLGQASLGATGSS